MTVRERTRHLGFVVVMAFSLVVAAAATAAAAGSVAPSKGPIPEAAWSSSGELDMTLVPDYVSQLGPDGVIVGYVSREAMIDPSGGARDALGRPIAATWPVYGEDLKTLVGYVVPDKGFVPVGVDPATVDSIPVTVAPAP